MVKLVKPTQERLIKNEILRTNILRNLLTGDYAGIPEHAEELNALRQRYGVGKTRELIISALDVVHDADASRDAVIHCANTPLFKLVVCEIFGISFSLYNYIHKKIVPVSQRVLLRLVEGSVGYSGSKADEYFRKNFEDNPTANNCSFVRDNVGISSELQKIAIRVGAIIAEKKTGSIILDSVSRTMTLPDYVELDAWVAANNLMLTVTNELFPGRVYFHTTGSLAGDYKVQVRYDPSYIQTGGGKNPKSSGWVDVKKSEPTTGVRKEKASITTLPPPNYSMPAKRATASVAADKRSDADGKRILAAAAAAIDRTPNQFDGLRTFRWNPKSNPLIGYRPINCTDPPNIGGFAGVPTCFPSNVTKNGVFLIALPIIYTNVNLNTMYDHFTAYANGVGNHVYTGGIVPITVSQFIQLVNTELRNHLLPICIRLGVNQQIFTLQEYVLYKLGGDYSYKLYYIDGFLFVSTSDIILGLRLYLSGCRVLFTTKEGGYIFSNRLNPHANVVRVNLAHVVNSDIRSGGKKKLALKKNVEAAALAAASAANAAARAKDPNAPVVVTIVTKYGRLSVPPRRFTPLTGGEGQKSSFNGGLIELLKKLLKQDWLYKNLLEQKLPVTSPASPDHLKILRSLLETQFKLFIYQLANFKKEGKFFIASNSTVDYKSSCTTIIEFLECIINIMSSAECIQDFSEKCSGKSYEECDKIMCSYVLMFPFIFDTETSSWYLNCTYPFSVCLNEYILSLLDLPSIESKYQNIINFVSSLKTSSSDSPSNPLEYGKKMSFNTAVTFVIMYKCIKTGTQQQFSEQYKLYKQQSNLQLTKFDDTSLREFFLKQLLPLIPKDPNSDVEVTSDDTGDDTRGEDVTPYDTDYFKEIDNFFQNFVVDNNILYEDFAKKMVSFLIPEENIIIREGVFSVIKFILLFQSFDNISLCSYTVIKTIIEALLNQKYVNESFAFINNEFNILFYYNNLDNFFQDIREVVEKIKETRIREGLTSIDRLSILEKNISVLTDLYGYSLDYALSKFYDELYHDSIDSGHTFETTDEYVDFQMEKLQKFINEEVDKYLSYHEVTDDEEEEEERLGQVVKPPPPPQVYNNPLPSLNTAGIPLVTPVGAGGKNNRISNPKHNTKYRKKYKKFVSKYIIKKKKNNNKNNNKNNKNNKNKTRKNKRLTKSTPNSKRNNKTLKNKKSKSKLKLKSSKHKSNHKSKHNKKTKTNYYNYYKHKKTLKH
jgi:hypothetical protein